MASTFSKTHRGAAVEAASLRWLATADAIPVVPIISHDGDRLTLERLITTAPTRAAATTFGRQLAALHDSGAPAFGSPPPGWAGPGFIGLAPLSFAQETSWGRFYAQHRILPYLDGISDADVLHALCARLEVGDFDDAAPPARIHGDLWSGNVMYTPNGVTLIDPAAHGGHRVTDLAMLALFHAPYLQDVFNAYEDASNHLPKDWRDLIPLHQIHPLLVHHILFGSGYGREAVKAAERYL